ncbi:MAG: phenyltransferase domain-containing protein [Desulfobacteraceae bacterium]|nr:MAG: phenyltransferase domain-containing protein [Desulfobacteraceae bacterium]
MNFKISSSQERLSLNIESVAAIITKIQLETGEIPWSINGHTDPWDHIESIMGLTIGGHIENARKGFEWLLNNQLERGAWYSSYRKGVPDDKTLDTNMTSYIAVGAFHHYLITKDKNYLHSLWPSIKKAIDFSISLQAPTGAFYWAESPQGVVDQMSLLTGSSSIFMSLKCALSIAGILHQQEPGWKAAKNKLLDAIQYHPHLFNVTKSRFSMDWFYPILSGALTGEAAYKRIDKYWKKFVVDGLGVRCVSDEPWITLAETSEFVLALAAMGNYPLAKIIFSWIQDRCYDDGTCWCGFTFPNMIIWPEDKMSWTNGVALMAADALYEITPASRLFSHQFWEESEFSQFV